ncbi:trypsin-like peptidase domain-containing protein [Prosthecobacter sp.]|uniref:trypsin-like peptidase domain-containing protein n=1 Tax=Prosthecobacter sp. TaxID=1965333 RepID=UPI0037846916
MRFSFFHVVGALCVSFLLESCVPFRGSRMAEPEAPPLRARDMQRAVATLNARRPASLKEWTHRKIGDGKALDYAALRWAVLFNSHNVLRVANRPRLALVALASDGEFHCVKPDIVWRGNVQKGEPDLALIHAPLTPYRTHKLAGFDELKKGPPIFTCGNVGEKRPGIAYSGGCVTSLGPVMANPPGARWRLLEHTATVTPGDSGGPVIEAGGQVLGINTRASFDLGHDRLRNYHGVSVAPDSAWIQSLIERHRSRPRFLFSLAGKRENPDSLAKTLRCRCGNIFLALR